LVERSCRSVDAGFGARCIIASQLRMNPLALGLAVVSLNSASAVHVPAGRFLDLGGWSIYMHCTGRGGPTVVVETGFDEFAADWTLVQDRVARHTRICTYDRAGYGFSDAGPMPRTLDQINLDLHRALAKAGEHGPFILVGHSFGGPVVRNYAQRYPTEVAGVALIEATPEAQSIIMGGKPVQLISFASDKPIPKPSAATMPVVSANRFGEADPKDLDSDTKLLPADALRWHAWAAQQPKFKAAGNSEREWSPNYLKRMVSTPQEGTLGTRPLVVMTRAEGGYDGLNPELSTEMEANRNRQQLALTKLSTRGRQIIQAGGHNLHLTAPEAVAKAINQVVDEVRTRHR
jgi:pimeloyl-ACP methyl ester carboxylesterase